MAENKEGQEKTEEATAKRLNEARLRGQVSKSMDVTTSAIILFGGLALYFYGKIMFPDITRFASYIFRNSSSIQITSVNIDHYYLQMMMFFVKVLLPLIATIASITFIAEVSQVGLKIATKKFSEGLRFDQVFNPFKGLKRIFFSTRSIFELIKSVFKLIIVGLVAYSVLSNRSVETVGLLQRPFNDIGTFLVDVSLELILKVGCIYILIAIGDFMYQRHKFKEEMKMTKHEVKEEGKQTEGDPKIKARLRQIMRQRIRKLMLQNVEKADVVITNPTHFAVALKYTPGKTNAPIVVAKGVDYLALQIRELAIRSDIPIVEEPPLARALYFTVEVDREIPDNLFKAVAQILAYVYHLRKKTIEY